MRQLKKVEERYFLSGRLGWSWIFYYDQANDPVELAGLYIFDRNKLPPGYRAVNLELDTKEYGFADELIFWPVNGGDNQLLEHFMFARWVENKQGRRHWDYVLGGIFLTRWQTSGRSAIG